MRLSGKCSNQWMCGLSIVNHVFSCGFDRCPRLPQDWLFPTLGRYQGVHVSLCLSLSLSVCVGNSFKNLGFLCNKSILSWSVEIYTVGKKSEFRYYLNFYSFWLVSGSYQNILGHALSLILVRNRHRCPLVKHRVTTGTLTLLHIFFWR